MKTTRPVCFLALTLFALSLANALSANLAVNGDFESGNFGFTTSYLFKPGDPDPEGVYDIATNPAAEHPFGVNYGDHTTGSGSIMIVNGSPAADTLVWAEAISVNPSSQYVYSFVGLHLDFAANQHGQPRS
jgi:hypothetical protein